MSNAILGILVNSLQKNVRSSPKNRIKPQKEMSEEYHFFEAVLHMHGDTSQTRLVQFRLSKIDF